MRFDVIKSLPQRTHCQRHYPASTFVVKTLIHSDFRRGGGGGGGGEEADG